MSDEDTYDQEKTFKTEDFSKSEKSEPASVLPTIVVMKSMNSEIEQERNEEKSQGNII